MHRQESLPSISWRVMILPQIEEAELYAVIKPKNDGGATDWSARGTAIPVYACPSAPPMVSDPNLLLPSHYAGVSGTNRGDPEYELEDTACGDIYGNGIFYPRSAINIKKITDGTTHTLAVGEKMYNYRDWMSGATWSGLPRPTLICSGSASEVLYPINADPDTFGYYIGDFSAPPAAPKIPLNHLYFGSAHSGGAQFIFADGSVHLLSEDIEIEVFKDLATRNGGETSTYKP
jgi:prepilin-type processing-associated H-X9-DG protein